MSGLKDITVIGNVGGEVTTRFTDDGTQVTSFSIAVNDRVKGQEVTTWFRASCWRKTAEVASQYVAKGKQVCVQGNLTTNEFTGQDGKPRFSLEVNVDKLVLLGRAGDAPEEGAEEAAPRQQRGKPAAAAFEDDDSIPF